GPRSTADRSSSSCHRVHCYVNAIRASGADFGAHASARAITLPSLARTKKSGSTESCSCDSSFPLMEVQHLDPDLTMFRAAFTSRSCQSPHRAHCQVLTTSRLRPLGPKGAPQLEHTREV